MFAVSLISCRKMNVSGMSLFNLSCVFGLTRHHLNTLETTRALQMIEDGLSHNFRWPASSMCFQVLDSLSGDEVTTEGQGKGNKCQAGSLFANKLYVPVSQWLCVTGASN